ncbi:hypothetical protein GJAV_G00240480 [Gymnothorax javanicus]|nr:hypothetical protein GJAV_G00240480 [Gymnothorax javanicus]
MPSHRIQGCRSLHINEDSGRFLLLAILIILYLLCGAAVFSAIERPSELKAHGRWNRTLHNFSETFNISLQDLNSFLRDYEAAIATGIRADTIRPRWDFTGAFYFVGTVVSTIERSQQIQTSECQETSCVPGIQADGCGWNVNGMFSGRGERGLFGGDVSCASREGRKNM